MTLHRIGMAGLLHALRRAERAPLMTRLVAALSACPGRIVTQAEIADAVWGDREDGGPDWARVAVAVVVVKLRRRGVPIQGHKHRGYSLARAA